MGAMAKDKLNPKQQAFADAIVAGMNPSEAYRAAGYSCARMSPASIAVEAQRKLKHPQISLIVEEGRKAAAEAARWTLALATERMRIVNDKAIEEIEQLGFVKKSPAYRAVMDSADRLNRYTGVEREIDAPEPDERPFGVDFALLIPGSWNGVHRAIMAHDATDYVFPGGRGSAKSSDVSLHIPAILAGHPDVHAVVFRKVARTLRTSVYAQMSWALSAMGKADEWDCTVSPMQMRHRRTGQTISFLGLDEKEKAKSLKVPFGYVGVVWYEETDQFSGAAEIRSVNQSLTRGGELFWRFYSYNPPRSKNSWVNAFADDGAPGKIVHRSTYLDVPPEWLGRAFVDDAEALKEINEQAYRHEYLGEMVGTDGEVFRNVEDRELTDEDVEGFAWTRCGVDWGYAVDPWVFVRVAYDRKTKTVYVFDEDRGLRLSNEQTASRIKARLSDEDRDGSPTYLPRAPRNRVYADAAEPKSVASYRAQDIDCRAAAKWPGSVEEGIQWLQTRAKIVIDRKRCPLAYQEFSAYEYEVDKDGKTLESYPDRDNHAIDAVRYALSPLIADKKEV